MYQVIVTVQDGVVNDSVKTELSENEVLEFEQIWKDNWFPQLSDERAQMSEQEWRKRIELSKAANKKSDAEKEKLHPEVQIQDVKFEDRTVSGKGQLKEEHQLEFQAKNR